MELRRGDTRQFANVKTDVKRTKRSRLPAERGRATCSGGLSGGEANLPLGPMQTEKKNLP